MEAENHDVHLEVPTGTAENLATTDRELLALAAKAAGLRVTWEGDNQPYPRATDDGNWNPAWNPLASDGDALRLAVKLGLLVDVRYTRPEAARYNEVMYWPTPVKGQRIIFGDREMDPCAATRRAIVRAAAALASA